MRGELLWRREELKEWPHRATRLPKEVTHLAPKNGLKPLLATLAAHRNHLGKF